MLEYINKFPSQRVAVVGDVMLDGYVWGRAGRISPEAPVPVVEVDRITSCLGGAANVMRNVATLGGQVTAFGVTGRDRDGEEIRKQLQKYGISPDNLVEDAARRTTHKQRVIAGTQQLLRVDYEDVAPVSENIREAIADRVIGLVERGGVDAVIFEDYGKGLLSEAMIERVVEAAVKAGVITLLDPKPGNLAPVKHLTMMKPNRNEAMLMAGIKERPGENRIAEAAAKILEQWELEYLLISLAADGMALSRPERELKLIPTRAREVFDVSGAGDTVVATCALALSAGASPEIAAELANYAAGIVVGKVGTVTIAAEELKNNIAGTLSGGEKR